MFLFYNGNNERGIDHMIRVFTDKEAMNAYLRLVYARNVAYTLDESGGVMPPGLKNRPEKLGTFLKRAWATCVYEVEPETCEDMDRLRRAWVQGRAEELARKRELKKRNSGVARPNLDASDDDF